VGLAASGGVTIGVTKPAPVRPQTTPETITVQQFDRMPYLTILTYPRPNLSQARSRMTQLAKLGFEKIVFEGSTNVGRLGLVAI